MKRDILEQIIRQVLNEGKIQISIETLRPTDETAMNSLHDDLNITSKLSNEINKFAAADGFLIKIKRIGGRSEDETGKKSYELDPIALRAKAIQQIDTLSGAYAPMKSSEYIWFISPNVNENPRDIKKSKDTRVIATYIIQAFYVKSSLISKPATLQNHPASGYITTTASNGLIYDKSKIVRSQWRYEVKTGTEIPSQIQADLGAPLKELKFGQKDSTAVRLLFLYFSENLTSILPASDVEKLREELKQESTFGNFHKAFIEAFQKEQNLPITGDYDTETLQRVSQLNKDSYTFENTDDLKTRINKAIDATRSIIDVSNIIVPAGGFKYKVTDNDPEFAKVQALMIGWLQKSGIDTSVKHSTKFNEWQTSLNKQTDGIFVNRGDFDDVTKYFVELIKKVPSLGLGNDYSIVNQNFIDAIK
jgi:hypothetical protein